MMAEHQTLNPYQVAPRVTRGVHLYRRAQSATDVVSLAPDSMRISILAITDAMMTLLSRSDTASDRFARE